VQPLRELQCVPCQSGEASLSNDEIERLKPHIPDWKVVEREGEKQLERLFKFKDFARALEFTNRVGEAAEAEDHHPMLVTEWGKVTVTWWTHKIKGLHQNDFIMAARTDQMYQDLNQAQAS